MQQASYLEWGPLIWILPLYLHVNQNSSDDDDDDDDIQIIYPEYWDILTPYHTCPKILMCLK